MAFIRSGAGVILNCKEAIAATDVCKCVIKAIKLLVEKAESPTVIYVIAT